MRVSEMTAERLVRVLGVNVVGPFLCSREAVRRMYRPSVIRTTLSSSTAGTATRVRIRNFESQYGLPSSCRTRTGWSTTRSRYGTTLFACVSSPGSGSTRTS